MLSDVVQVNSKGTIAWTEFWDQGTNHGLQLAETPEFHVMMA